jgi:hypothetical protein
MKRPFTLILLVALCSFAFAAPPTLKTESFDRDPAWDAYNNHVTPRKIPTIHQDFGYSTTLFAGKAAGEIGGQIQRSATPASYAAAIKPITLDDPLSASGSFAVTASHPGAGVFFGFFNANQPGGSGRPIGSLGLDFDFEATGGRLAVRLINSSNKSCGTFITPFLPGKFRPTPIRNDGTRYHFTLKYDPHANQENGRFTFTLQSDHHPIDPADDKLPETHRAEALRRFPHTTTFTVDLPPGFKKENATFDRFGIINMMKAGGAATIYFDDLQFNDQAQEFATDPANADPKWIGAGNRTTFEDKEPAGAHHFGFSPDTQHAGGQKPGEVGGILWRSKPFGYYADTVGPLDLNHPLEAHGKIHMLTAGPDSDLFLGFFNSDSAKENEQGDAANCLAIHIGGPTRVGHYFSPVCVTAHALRAKLEKAPLLAPGKTLDWSLSYDPAANHNNGQITVTLGKESATLPLKPNQKPDNATFNRFGLFTIPIGGQMIKIYLDDLTYTSDNH